MQTLLGGKVYKAHELTYAGELITCEHCGRPVTGEVVIKKQTGKEYIYYRCSRCTQPNHPRDRVREQDLDAQVLALFDQIKQPEPVQQWFREALIGWSADNQSRSRTRATDIQSQLDDVRRQQDRLLNIHLAGTIDTASFSAKNTEFRDRVAALTLDLESTDRRKDERADLALTVFELSQSLNGKWVTADYATKRQILDWVCLNLVLKGATLGIATRKPFNCLVEGLSVSISGEGGIRTPVTVTRQQHFQCCSFSRSDTSPKLFQDNDLWEVAILAFQPVF